LGGRVIVKMLQALRLTLSFIKFEWAASQFSGVAFGKKSFWRVLPFSDP
jgi:hypothetical protein